MATNNHGYDTYITSLSVLIIALFILKVLVGEKIMT